MAADAESLIGTMLITNLDMFYLGHYNRCECCFNSLGPINAMRHYRIWSTLVQVMTCCVKTPSHYLNQCWQIISEILWHSTEYSFTWTLIVFVTHELLKMFLLDMSLKITYLILQQNPRNQWVNDQWTVSQMAPKIWHSGASRINNGENDLMLGNRPSGTS